MTASSCGPLLEGLRRLLRNQWLVAIAILVTAMAIRWEFHLWNPHPTGFFIYHGSPISDGSSYTFKAINIAKGYGIPPAQQPAIRPFYSIILACLYAWTGFSLGAVTALNIVIGGATAALIYLCGALVFNRLCALGAALFFAIDPTQLIQIPQAGTEPLGLLFFVGSVYAVLLAFKNRQAAMFCLSGLLIGLSNLTRTLTVFTLPFYIALILLVGWRERAPKAAAIRVFLMLFGFFCVMLPWLIRQERLYGIVSLSDNIGEAIYAATSPHYKQWTPVVRKDADAAGIPNTVGDRYRYFIDRAVENVKTNPRFYLRNVGAALWEYANTFGPRSRATNRYANWFSSAAQGQRVLLIYLLVFTFLVWLLRRDRPFAPSNLLFLLISFGLVVLYQTLPPWATFVPVLSGIVFAWRAGRRMPNLILSGTLAAAVLGSAIFANPVLFRAILMTDWLFALYFLAAVWFPAETLSRRLAGEPGQAGVAGTEEDEPSSFQNALYLLSRRSCLLLVIVTLGFFFVSGARLITLSVSNQREKGKTQSSPGWSLGRGLTVPDKVSILQRLQRSPFSILPEDSRQLPIYQGGKDLLNVGDYLVEIEGFYYDYYIPSGETLPYRMLGPKPYVRTLVRLSRFEFIFTGEIPADFANRPLLFVGVVVPQEVDDREQSLRPLVSGLAIVPLGGNGRPDFVHAVCAPPACDFTR
jgi:4-amino-4-deoxy-L-arabinose transferase-like glycosyltransferase